MFIIKYPLDIETSIKKERLIYKKPLFTVVFEWMSTVVLTGFFIYLALLNLLAKVHDDASIVIPVILLLFSFAFFALVIYSKVNINTLTRLKGISRGKNSMALKHTGEVLNWNLIQHNQQKATFQLSWEETYTDWGKQLIILYDKEDILINCTSYGLGSMPSEFHWFSNRKTILKFKKPFFNKLESL